MGETSISSTTQLALSPLLAPLSSLDGIGPKTSELIARAVGGYRVIDLLFHLPENIIDRRYRPQLQNAIPGRIVTVKLKVIHIERPLRSKQPWRIHVTDGTKNAELSFFSQWQAKKIQPNTQIIVSGTLETYGNRLQITNPHYLESIENEYMIPLIEPVWPLTAGLFPKNLYKALRSALSKCPILPEWIDPTIVQQNQWPRFKDALHLLHFPGDFPELFDNQSYEAAESRARSRLAFDELFAEQLAIGQAKRATQKNPGRALIGDQTLSHQALEQFGYPLTQSQVHALQEIKQDLERPFRMLRLLQGDVGSGKTIVALLTALHAVEAGYQAVIMAPTEILARQHFEVFSQLCSVETVFLSGSVKGSARKEALEKIQNGDAKIAIGTHALFQEGVAFHNLALVIIDEQHRFGVEQRIKLGDKGENTDILVMTATPIPRTLLLTRWGELQVSRLTQKPAGRKPIHTTLHNLGSMEQILQGVERMVSQGCQIFWVCPLVEESEVMDLAAAKDRFNELKHHFGEDIVGLAHGQQDSQERQDALDAFAQNKTKILVATTVIEVGVNIPNANIMVIEHAERFGLAQLHQLRGRVGRGEKQSYCLLLHDDKINFTAKKRLALLRDTEDGFLIADEDFKIRGGGEVTGRRQSGLPDFKVVDEIRLEQWLNIAWQSSEQWFQYEPKASMQQKQTIEILLLLFAKSNAGRLLRSG
ncbi:RecG-like helicase (RecG) (PDB:1GM5) [Commensalibacter communis]|uniref:ATP-dependent DNA helicase RecG n=1 Tax=Commensalibacter communis TaxID=2972786 RepID=UPI0022FFBA49|nr:ATP-dependent DNA helicase RecG [Commensalibacter communis]CAI3928784.1 RecG-like helicase (RecG) (PDB:1GM5) [Commensalibacter communis]